MTKTFPYAMNLLLKPSYHISFTHAFTSLWCIFEELTLFANQIFENTHVSMESVIRMQLYLTRCHTLLQSTDNLALHAVAVLTSVLALDGVAVVINSSVGVTPEVSNKLLWRLFQKARSFCTLYSTFKTIGLLCKQYHIKLDSEIDTCLHSWRGWWSGASPSWFPRYTYTCNKKGFS